jgi:hypothetical protein
MRSLILTLCTVACFTQVHAQDDSSSYTFYVGPYLAAKGSIKTSAAEGTKTGPAFNVPPDLGAQILAPIPGASWLRVGLDVGLATYSYDSKPESNATDDNTIREQYQFINVFPHLNLYGVVLGVNIGFPSSASAQSLSGNTESVYGTVSQIGGMNIVVPDDPDASGYDPSKYLATMLEFRIGGSIPLVSSSTGILNLNIMAGYTLNALFTNGRNYLVAYEGTSYDETLNPRVASLSLGLSYVFGIHL